MKPMYKGVGLIALATGATVLAISLLGSKEANDSQELESSTASAETASSVETASGKVELAAAPAGDAITNMAQEAQAVVQAEPSVAQKQVEAAAPTMEAPATEVQEPTSSATAEVQAPPPGLYRDGAEVSADSMSAPAAPAAPTGPAELNAEPPAKPENIQADLKAPEAPKGLFTGAVSMPAAPESPKAEVAPAAKAQPAMAATPTVDAGVTIAPPPPMPDLGNLAVEAPAEVISETKMEVAKEVQAPAQLVKPEMNIPPAPVMDMPQGMEMPSAPDAVAEGINPAKQVSESQVGAQPEAMPMPTAQMPAPAQRKELNMGNPAMQPGYNMPRVYYVPVPVYSYGGQHYMPYGYPYGAPQMPNMPMQKKPGPQGN